MEIMLSAQLGKLLLPYIVNMPQQAIIYHYLALFHSDIYRNTDIAMDRGLV